MKVVKKYIHDNSVRTTYNDIEVPCEQSVVKSVSCEARAKAWTKLRHPLTEYALFCTQIIQDAMSHYKFR